MSDSGKAVFLSYASQDADAARRIAQALRAEGIEVWFDESALAGGEAWDASIRRQIRDCALFVAIVSASTQGRKEGYFRLEWKLADERSQLIAEGTPFVLPVIIDGTKERDALVPKSFLGVQWTWLPHGEVPPAFVQRVAKLLGNEVGATARGANTDLPMPRPRSLSSNLAPKTVLPWAMTAVLAVVAIALYFRRPAPTISAPPPLAALIELPAAAGLALGAHPGFDNPPLALSADGRWLVFVGRNSSGSQLYRRRLDAMTAPEPIPGTDGALFAFFSPKGEVVGFLTEERLNRVSINGDDLRTLGRVRGVVRAVWATNGWIYMHEGEGLQKIRRVREEGGTLEDLLTPGSGYAFSDLLPDGRHALGTLKEGVHGDFAEVLILDLQNGTTTPLQVAGSDPRWLPTGHILIARGGNLQAVPFDIQTRTVRGEAVTVVRGVDMAQHFMQAQVAVSPSGVLAYVPGGDRAIGRVVAVGRQDQKPKPLPLAAGKYGVVDLSPDDRFLAIHVGDVHDYVIIFDLKTDEWWKLSGSDGFGWPIWNPDSSAVAVGGPLKYTNGKPQRTLQVRAADRTASLQQTITLPFHAWVDDWHPQERILAISNLVVGEMQYLRLEDSSLAAGPGGLEATRWGTVFSPDGKAIAYYSDESGRGGVWLNTYPPGTARQFSEEGVGEPVWSRNGEIFYRRGNEWFAARVSSGSLPIREGSPQRAFALTDFLDTPGRSYDVSSDGQTLYTVQRASRATEDKIHVIGNWFTEVRRLVPSK